MPVLLLDLIEARVLGVLVEKQATTPDVYPLTVNALLSGCNQKTSRDPILSLTESDVQQALDSLRGKTLVQDSYGASGRVLRYSHNFDRCLKLSPPALAIVAVLMLRGPQTPGELRGNCDRLYRFSDISSLEAYLEELAERGAQPLVQRLPKQPGAREHRFAHLLCGAPSVAGGSEVAAVSGEAGDELATLRAEVQGLRTLVEHLYAELGVSRPDGSA